MREKLALGITAGAAARALCRFEWKLTSRLERDAATRVDSPLFPPSKVGILAGGRACGRMPNRIKPKPLSERHLRRQGFATPLAARPDGTQNATVASC